MFDTITALMQTFMLHHNILGVFILSWVSIVGVCLLIIATIAAGLVVLLSIASFFVRPCKMRVK